MHKNLFLLVAIFSLLVCCTNSASSNPGAGDSETAAGEGTLYIRTFYWTMNNTMEIYWIWLGKDGTIVKNPKHGTTPVSVSAEKKDNSESVGKYKVNGNEMTVTWNNGKQETWLAQKKANVYSSLNKGVVTVAKPLAPNFRFDKEFSASTVLSDEDYMHSLEFHKDGTLLFKKFSTQDSKLPDGAKGTYTIDKNTLRIHFDNGKKETANIATIDFFSGNAKHLLINTNYQDL